MCASSSSVLFSPFQVLFTIFFHSFSILGLVHHLLPFFQAPKNPFHLNPFFLLHLNPFLKIPNPNYDLNQSKNPNPKITISSCVAVMRFLGFCVAHDFFLRWCFLSCIAVISGLLWCDSGFLRYCDFWFCSLEGNRVLESRVPMEIDSFKLDLLQ